MNNEIIISSAISVAAVVISAAQIYIAHLNKKKEIRLAQSNQERDWNKAMAEFVLDNYEDIFCTDQEKRSRIRNVIRLAYPEELSNILFEQIDSLVLTELLSPMFVHLNRTKDAFLRWTGKNEYLEMKIIRESNLAMRNILINKAYLIPDYLMEDASKLIAHFDAWLEEFNRVRGNEEISNKTTFVFVGPKGSPFPIESEKSFKEAFTKMREDLENHNNRVT